MMMGNHCERKLRKTKTKMLPCQIFGLIQVFRYRQVKKECPNCQHSWSDDVTSVMNNLKKVIGQKRDTSFGRYVLFAHLLLGGFLLD